MLWYVLVKPEWVWHEEQVETKPEVLNALMLLIQLVSDVGCVPRKETTTANREGHDRAETNKLI